MSQKRLLEDGASQSAARELRRRFSALPSLGRRVTDAEPRRPPILEFLVQGLEGRLRRVIREELNEGLQRILQPDPRPRIQINGEHPFKLHFNHRLPQTLYTGDRIRSEKCEIVQVVLHNAMTGDIIRTGNLSCMTIRIIVLDGSFDEDEEGSWTTQQFHSSQIGPREGKQPLLKGQLEIKLRDGIAYLKDIAFTDNSRWRRTGKFKLGASLIRRGQAEGVREAISEAFVVKDGRGKASQKPDSPAFIDEVWRLKNIRKDGKFHRSLKDEGVETVVQFRMRLANDPGGLRRILGFRMSDKKWKQTVEHALKSEMPGEGINCGWNPGEYEAQSSGQNQSSLANFTERCWQLKDSPVMNELPFEALPDVLGAPDPTLQTQGNPEPLIPQGADLNFVQPAATFNEYVGGATGSNYFGSVDDPLQSPLNVTVYRGCKPSTSEFAASHPSPADENALVDSFFVSSPDFKGRPIRSIWLKVRAVLKWSIKKKVPKKKRWLKVGAVLKLTLTKAVL